MDELVAVSKRITLNDASSAAVILDFKLRRVEKAHLDGTTLPRDFDRIRGFYAQYYKKIIQDLEAIHPPPGPTTLNTETVSS